MCPIRNENKLKGLTEVNILITTQRRIQTVHEGVMETQGRSLSKWSRVDRVKRQSATDEGAVQRKNSRNLAH